MGRGVERNGKGRTPRPKKGDGEDEPEEKQTRNRLKSASNEKVLKFLDDGLRRAADKACREGNVGDLLRLRKHFDELCKKPKRDPHRAAAEVRDQESRGLMEAFGRVPGEPGSP